MRNRETVSDQSREVGQTIELRRGPQSGMVAVIVGTCGDDQDPFYIGKVPETQKQVVWHWKSVVPASSEHH